MSVRDHASIWTRVSCSQHSSHSRSDGPRFELSILNNKLIIKICISLNHLVRIGRSVTDVPECIYEVNVDCSGSKFLFYMIVKMQHNKSITKDFYEGLQYQSAYGLHYPIQQ